MDTFDVCRACRCHIKRRERHCPFCGAPHVLAPVPARRIARMSRARWLAFGSTLTLMSCNDSTSKITTNDAAGVDTALSDAASDTGAESSLDDVVDVNVVADAAEEADLDVARQDAGNDAEDAPNDTVAADIAPSDAG